MRHLIPICVLACASVLAACGQNPKPAGNDAAAVEQRAIETQTASRRTGAEIQDSALNRVIRTVYLCDNGERLTVDFDNPRSMATIRNSHGEAVDLFKEPAADGLWYRSGRYGLRGKGIHATWTADGRPDTECRAID